MLKQLLMTLVVLGLAGGAMAQEAADESTTSTTTLDESDKGLTEVLPPEKDLDQEITNARLRAESGSRSKWSMSIQTGYNGGSIADPFSSERPDILLGIDDTAVDSYVDIKGRYRIDKNQSLAVGTGLTMVQPFHGSLESVEAARNASSPSSPYLTWSSYYKAADLQMSSGVTFTYYTAESSVAAGRTAAVNLSQSVLDTFIDDKLTMGVSVSGTYYQVDNSREQLEVYNQYRAERNQAPQTFAKFQEGSTDISLGIYPFAEYTLTDTYAIRTVFGYFNFRHVKDTDEIERYTPYQSLGVAMSLGRDLYVYPNIQFIPTDIRQDRTNVAVSATINLF